MVDRRSVLKLGGGAAALGVTGGVIALVARNGDDGVGDGEAFESIDIDYGEYDSPEAIYRVWTGYPRRFSFVDDGAYTGETALRCAIPANASDGSNAMFWFPDNGYDQPREVTQRAMVRLSDDWTMADGDVCRFWSAGLNTAAGPHGSGGRGRPSGDDGWSSMFAVTERETDSDALYNLSAYTYHMDQDDASGEFEVIDAPVPAGKWFRFATSARMNTVSDGDAEPDGEVRCWLNGDLVYERTDFRWTTTETQAIEYAGPLVRYGGGETAPTDLAVFYDDHRLRGNGAADGSARDPDPFVADPSEMDAYESRITVATDEETTYRLYVDGYAVHTQWSNVDGHEAFPNETVDVSLAGNTETGYVTVEATAEPDTADGYLFDGELLALETDAELAELWVSGQRVDPDEYPSAPDE
ncbi:heparin lyase I family protein [Haloterrigena alkaliphila]|uniref:Uncharacterized protein n=1 Tax=Haloterrigena alkaliphila TaxID=2816475 RepID=A0A8A2VFH2_9EURY|nr:hypothetical protein [Haloterrigena alkaliphila]QSW99417.1 polysaccharide lyase [Haloterrigena alkaliphila]